MRSLSSRSSPRRRPSRRARASPSAGASIAESATPELMATSWASCGSSTASIRRSSPTSRTSTP
eukprot:4740518-Alexandrium_andersonii.AAC.1